MQEETAPGAERAHGEGDPGGRNADRDAGIGSAIDTVPPEGIDDEQDGDGPPPAVRRRRRGSRGGRGRSRSRAGQGTGQTAGGASEAPGGRPPQAHLGAGPEAGEDYTDPAADRGLTTDDVAADAAADAGLAAGAQGIGLTSAVAPSAGMAQPARPRIGDTRPALPVADAVQDLPGGDATGPAGAPRKRRRRGGRRRRGRGGGSGGSGAATGGSQESTASTQPAPPARPARSAQPFQAGRGREQSRQASAEALLDELDDEARERRRGGTRKGRPTGRYFMCVHVREGVATQIAVLEGRSLVEHYVSRPEASATAIDGNIYLGRVQNVLPGMEAAFIDIGTPKNGVLYRGDVSFDPGEVEGSRPKIERLLRNGQSVMVQVTKNPIGAKGARLTQDVSLAGRFVVMVPGQPETYGISKRMPDEERKRLRKVLEDLRPSDAGIIVRTAAEGATREELERDVRLLMSQWEAISKVAERGKAPLLLHEEPDLVTRVIREEFTKDYRGVVIDDPRLFREVRDYVAAITPELADRVELYEDELPMFERFHVHEQLHKALDRKVWLPSGGSLVIERTEALTVIDVNTGKNVGRSNLEETVYRNNLEAAEEVARQLRLRDIGGIIVIDFIDMEVRKNRDEVLRVFRDALSRDKTRTQVFEISELGLVQMTRKRVSEGLVESFSAACQACSGRGIVFDEALL